MRSTIDFSHDGVPHDLPREVALGLFHVLQQAIDNAVLHSETRNIAVDLRGCPSTGRVVRPPTEFS